SSFEGLTAICAGLDVARPAHVLDVATGGVVSLEREGFGESRECRFRLLGSMNASVNYRNLGEPRVHFALNCSALGCLSLHSGSPTLSMIVHIAVDIPPDKSRATNPDSLF